MKPAPVEYTPTTATATSIPVMIVIPPVENKNNYKYINGIWGFVLVSLMSFFLPLLSSDLIYLKKDSKIWHNILNMWINLYVQIFRKRREGAHKAPVGTKVCALY